MSPKKNLIALAMAGLATIVSVSSFSQTTVVPPATGTVPTTTATTSTPTLLAVDGSAPAGKLAIQYTQLAGSKTNAQQLVSGLRTGSRVTLTGTASGTTPPPPSATFTPATVKMGYGNINIALSLAKAELAKAGITNPTPAQLAAALNGGTVTSGTTTVTMAGVLAQRASGMGWGKIANTMGLKLGAVVSTSKTRKADDDQETTVAMRSKMEKSEKAENSKGATKSADARETGGSSNGNGGGKGNGGGNGGSNGGGNGGGKK